MLALPSWDDYLRLAVDDLIESGSSPHGAVAGPDRALRLAQRRAAAEKAIHRLAASPHRRAHSGQLPGTLAERGDVGAGRARSLVSRDLVSNANVKDYRDLPGAGSADARGSRPPARASAAPRCECASRIVYSE